MAATEVLHRRPYRGYQRTATVVIGRLQDEDPRPVAVFVTGWMREHLYLYARELWHRPR
jgi:hypothetical protein